jgi:outer membrane protein assembly factor BamB
MIAIGPLLREQSPLPAIRTLRSALVSVASAFALAACTSDTRVLDPVDAVARPFDSPVVARVQVFDNPKVLTVLGSTAGLHAVARDNSGSVMCSGHFVGCSSQLLKEPFEWAVDVPGVVSLAVNETSEHGTGVYVTALAEGRVEVTTSVGGARGTATVEVVERARVEWSVPILGWFQGVAIGEDGTVYASGSEGLQAVGPQGDLRWTLPTPEPVSIPAISGDGSMYLTTRDGLMAVDGAGNVLWVTPVDRIWYYRSPPAIGADGTIYLVTQAGTLYAVDPSGHIEWSFEAPGPDLERNFSPPAVGHDGTIYFGSLDRNLYAIAPDGSERWRFRTGGPVRSPSIGVDGTLYFANDRVVVWGATEFSVLADAKLFALNPDGTERWSVVLEDDLESAPAIDFDGTIYLGSSNWIYAFDPAGSLVWKEHWGTYDTPILAGDRTLYRGFADVSGLEVGGGRTWTWDAKEGAPGAPAIGFDGRVYAASKDAAGVNRLYAFTELGGDNGGYHRAPWPQQRGDRANTGRARTGP